MAEDTRKKPKDAERRALLDALAGSGGKRSLMPEEMIQNLQSGGYRIVKDDPAAERRRVAQVSSAAKARWEGGEVVRFGAYSCPHLCSRQQQISFLEAFYTRCEDEGITDIFCAGDVTDGDGRVYQGQMFDLFLLGADAQRGYIAETLPKRTGIRTHLIAGNHDMSFWSRGGVDILEQVAKERPDITYYGAYGADIKYEGIRIYLAHGDGGVAYARSYKPQRRIEQFAPEKKPDVYLLGHYHVWDHLPMYRNVISWQLGCFQSQTEYLRRKGVYPEIGGLLITIYRGTKGADRPGSAVRIVPEVVPLYIPKERDF